MFSTWRADAKMDQPSLFSGSYINQRSLLSGHYITGKTRRYVTATPTSLRAGHADPTSITTHDPSSATNKFRGCKKDENRGEKAEKRRTWGEDHQNQD